MLGGLCAALLLASGSSGQADEQPGKVVMGQISLSFYAVTGGVVQEVLERLGHTVEVVQGSHGQIFPRLGGGEVDLLVAAWLPYGHAVYWQQYGSQAEPLATLYRGARFAWMVPTYVPESLVAGVDDLKKPEVLARMDREIRGTGRDSGNMMVSAEVMKAYGLEGVGYKLLPGTAPEFHGNYHRAIDEGHWFVMPLWWPHYINQIGNMRPLLEPKGLLGEPSSGTLVGSKVWVARAPARTLRVLRRLYLGLDAVAAMDYSVNVQGLTPRDAARRWMQHHATRWSGSSRTTRSAVSQNRAGG
jgi:glycine betaine/proline transport system substrate-binding protein